MFTLIATLVLCTVVGVVLGLLMSQIHEEWTDAEITRKYGKR